MSRVGEGATPARALAHARLLGVLGGLTAVAPLGTDMFVPGLADLAADLDAPAWAVQLSLTGFLVGIVAGQLVLGPLSDRLGRRPVLLAGALGFAVSSGLAAFAPGIVWFDLIRLVQGFCGAAGLVVARAVVTDLFDDDESAGRFAALAAITALAPIAAPLLGGVVLSVASWRVVFVVLAVAGLLLALAAAAWVPETRQSADGAVRVGFTDMLVLARHRRFAGLVLTLSLANAAIFAYIGAAPFVFAGDFGFSPAMISVVFGVNAAGNLGGALLFRYVAGRVPKQRAARSALLMATVVAVALAALTAAGAAPAALFWAGLLVAVAAFGVHYPAVTTETQNAGRAAPGGASALLGAGQFTLGAVVSPLVGVFHGSVALPLAAMMAVCFALATTTYALAGRVART